MNPAHKVGVEELRKLRANAAQSLGIWSNHTIREHIAAFNTILNQAKTAPEKSVAANACGLLAYLSGEAPDKIVQSIDTDWQGGKALRESLGQSGITGESSVNDLVTALQGIESSSPDVRPFGVVAEIARWKDSAPGRMPPGSGPSTPAVAAARK